MNVIQRICEKYKTEYYLMPDFPMYSVDLTFSPQVPLELQDKILDGMGRLGVPVESLGMSMSLDVSAEKPDSYTLTVSGQEMFHFTTFAGIPFVGYDISEAVIWTVYILASRKDWLDAYQGRYISCRCFSARQQAAAAQISSSVTRQYQSSISQDAVRTEFEKLRAFVKPFAAQAPRISAQPIEESVFEKYRGRSAESTLQQIAQRLFGDFSFEQEQYAYCQLVQSSNVYQQYLEDASQQLVETACNLPIMSVNNLFTELDSLICEIEPVNSSEYRRLLQETVNFSLSGASLKLCFEKVDQAWLYGIQTRLETDFLQAVCSHARAIIDQEFAAARRSIMQLKIDLSRFCFIRPESFEQSGTGTLSWRKLSHLTDRDIYSKDISWTQNSLNDLQIVMSRYSPQLWICSEKLRNLSEMHHITGAHLTKAAPILDERLVWAIWVDV